LLIENPLGSELGLGPLPIELWGTGEFVGYCGLIIGSDTFHEQEIACELAGQHHGQGYATEAARPVVEAAARTGRRRLWATVREWNSASFRGLDKIGLERSKRLTKDAERGDLIWMSVGSISRRRSWPAGCAQLAKAPVLAGRLTAGCCPGQTKVP
jgi:RimJ/RimL family protein N-acetyltransferase